MGIIIVIIVAFIVLWLLKSIIAGLFQFIFWVLKGIVTFIAAVVIGPFIYYKITVNLILLIFTVYGLAQDMSHLRLLCVVGGVIGLFIKESLELKKSYVNKFFLLECFITILLGFGARTLNPQRYQILIFNILNLDISLFNALSLALPISLIVGAVWFTLDCVQFRKKYSEDALFSAINESDHPLNVANFVKGLHIEELRRTYIYKRLNILANREDVFLLRVNNVDYMYGKRGFNRLINNIEKYLKKNGCRESMEIASGITGDSTAGLYIHKALGVLIKGGRVNETAIGRDPSDTESKQPERYIFSHVDKPMKTVEIEID